MTFAREVEGLALLAAALVLAFRSAHRPPLRPLAASLVTLAAVDLARALAPPRWLDVALYAAWYVAQALAVAVGLGGPARPLAAAALAWWLVELARILIPPALAGPALAAEWWALWACATGAQLVAVARWLPGAVRRGGWPGEGEVAVLLITAGAVADGVGPWLAGAAGASERWEVGRWQSVGTWACVAGASVWRAWRERRGQAT